MSPPSHRTLALLDGDDLRVPAIWRRLEATARPTYFLTWGWVETWLSVLPREAIPQLAVIRERGEAVAAFFLGQRRLLRHRFVPLRGMYLNTTGVPRFDELCVEHNGLLARPGMTCPLASLIELLPSTWDELVLPAVDVGAFEPLTVRGDYQLVVDREVVSPYVDLARVRAAGDYLSLLASNTRSQIRRARRNLGPSELEVAQTPARALAIYDELVALHTASWRSRGQAGAFADPWFDRFHRRLIERRFAHGEIELLRLRAGGKTVGCTYNMIANGQVLFYQSGLAAFDDPRIKPGYLCHAAAVDHAAAAGRATYDLLASNARYKLSLSTDAPRLRWLRVQRRLVRFSIEDQLRRWKHAYVAWRRRSDDDAPPSIARAG